MTRSRADRFLAPWVFVLSGVVFNILSAVITHYFIGLNTDEINVIDRKINSKQVLIDSLWQSRTELERKKEFFILLLANPANELASTGNLYRDYLNDLSSTYTLDEFQSRIDQGNGYELGLMLDLSRAAQSAIVESINSSYFETLALEEAKMPLERNNSRLFSIAIFLQVIGLILVLARDLRRQ
jgi:hypothetical protein